MITIDFTEDQLAELRRERFTQRHPRIQLKVEALLLKSMSIGHGRICKSLGISANTFRSYLRQYIDGGIAALLRFDSGGSVSELDLHRDAIAECLTENPPQTIAQAADAIEKLTGVRRGHTQIREFIKSLGFKRLKSGSLPAKADAEVQEHFKKTSCCLG